MTINFTVKGRLGNSIFRYMACAVICIISNNKYNHLSEGSIENPGIVTSLLSVIVIL